MSLACVMLLSTLTLQTASDPASQNSTETIEPKREAESQKENFDPHKVYNYKLSLGPYSALFDEGFGYWLGSHGRLWLLDVTGKRGTSGYIEYVNLHWRNNDGNGTREERKVDAFFLLARWMQDWTDTIYTFLTAGGTVGDLSFPRLQLEFDVNLKVPKHPFLVFTVGGGYRYYDEIRRPCMIIGASYSTPMASVSYRLWYDGSLASLPAHTHLVTLAFGQRLVAWVRMDLTWGDASHPESDIPRLSTGSEMSIETRGVGITVEKWIWPNFGIGVKAEVNESFIETSLERVTMHRYQIGVRPFFTF